MLQSTTLCRHLVYLKDGSILTKDQSSPFFNTIIVVYLYVTTTIRDTFFLFHPFILILRTNTLPHDK